MQLALRVLLPALVVASVGCSPPVPAPESTPESASAPAPELAPKGPPAAAVIRLDEATALIDAYVRREHPDLPPGTAFPLRDTTSPAVWKRLGVQLFRVIGDVEHFETFIVSSGRVRRIGKAFGGMGIVSFCPADVDGDGRDDLAFSYSHGSGEPRSRIAWTSLGEGDALERIAPEACTRREHFRLREAADGTVEVSLARTVVGTLTAGGETGARLELAPGVSPDVLHPGR